MKIIINTCGDCPYLISDDVNGENCCFPNSKVVPNELPSFNNPKPIPDKCPLRKTDVLITLNNKFEETINHAAAKYCDILGLDGDKDLFDAFCAGSKFIFVDEQNPIEQILSNVVENKNVTGKPILQEVLNKVKSTSCIIRFYQQDYYPKDDNDLKEFLNQYNLETKKIKYSSFGGCYFVEVTGEMKSNDIIEKVKTSVTDFDWDTI